MDRKEDVGVMRPGVFDTVVERKKRVVIARQENVVAAGRAKLRGQFEGKGEDDLLLDGAMGAVGARDC